MEKIRAYIQQGLPVWIACDDNCQNAEQIRSYLPLAPEIVKERTQIARKVASQKVDMPAKDEHEECREDDNDLTILQEEFPVFLPAITPEPTTTG